MPRLQPDWPTPSSHPDLFSANPQDRLRASAASTTWPSTQWPYGNQGAANAWLVLVGPSPGHEKRTAVDPTNEVTFGARVPLIGMSDWRKNAWDALIDAALGSDHSAEVRRYLVALINFTGENASAESTLSYQSMDNGVGSVVEKIRMMHPRVVLALSNAVFDRLAPALATTPLPADRVSVGPHGRPLRAASFKDPEAGFEVLLLKPSQHPSRPVRRPKHLPDLSGTELLTYGIIATVDRFLRS
jgi:hypothetical protein